MKGMHCKNLQSKCNRLECNPDMCSVSDCAKTAKYAIKDCTRDTKQLAVLQLKSELMSELQKHIQFCREVG